MRKIVLILLATLAILTISRFNLHRQTAQPTRQPFADVTNIDPSNLANLPPVSEAIEFFQSRIKRNPQDGVSYILLGELYLRQARETGDVASYQRAETALKQSLNLLPDYAPARASLAAVFYAQHNFVDALELAQLVYLNNPWISQALATAGDAHLALGNYPEAEKAYQELLQKSPTPAVLARLAHLAELRGDPEEALQLMQSAARQAMNSGGSRESLAWYWLRLGDLTFNMGQIGEAERYYETALKIFDNYYLGLAGLGKVRAAQGEYQAAIDLYQRATAIIPQPDLLASLGDLFTVIGQEEKAKLQYETVEYIGMLVEINQQVYNRQLANYYADHDMRLEEALRLALSELEYRKDIYGYDAAAWAYYKNGMFDQAQQSMELAMELGTRDAKLYYHAGMIARAQGRSAEAQRLLSEALAINPHFDLLQARQARVALNQLATFAR